MRWCCTKTSGFLTPPTNYCAPGERFILGKTGMQRNAIEFPTNRTRKELSHRVEFQLARDCETKLPVLLFTTYMEYDLRFSFALSPSGSQKGARKNACMSLLFLLQQQRHAVDTPFHIIDTAVETIDMLKPSKVQSKRNNRADLIGGEMQG